MNNNILVSEEVIWKLHGEIPALNLSVVEDLKVIGESNNYNFLVLDQGILSAEYKSFFSQQLIEFGVAIQKSSATDCCFTKEQIFTLPELEKPMAIFADTEAAQSTGKFLNIEVLNVRTAKENLSRRKEKPGAKKIRRSSVSRDTLETKINVDLDLDGTGEARIETGLHFFDHMLHQLAKHGNVDLVIEVKGDLEVDEHHTIEDTAIALGTAFAEALGNKMGIERYGFLLPMDDCLSQVAIDFGGRPWLVWDAVFNREKIGDMPTEMFFHFFKSFSDAAKCNLNIKAEGTNEHHKIESIFKAFAKAIKMAIKSDGSSILPTTKGTL